MILEGIEAENVYIACGYTDMRKSIDGLSQQILEKRKQVYEEAKLKHPERWSRSTRNWSLYEAVWLNPNTTKESELSENNSA